MTILIIGLLASALMYNVNEMTRISADVKAIKAAVMAGAPKENPPSK